MPPPDPSLITPPGAPAARSGCLVAQSRVSHAFLLPAAAEVIRG
jgi:hypothetical protein